MEKKSNKNREIVEVQEIYIKPLEPKEAEPVEVDGKRFLIFLVEDKNKIEMDRYDYFTIEKARVDCVEGTIRIYPALGGKNLLYNYKDHTITTIYNKQLNKEVDKVITKVVNKDISKDNKVNSKKSKQNLIKNIK